MLEKIVSFKKLKIGHKKIFKIIILLLLNLVVLSSYIFATENGGSAGEYVNIALNYLLSGILGILLFLPLLFAYAILITLHLLVSALAYLGGTGAGLLTPYDIFFNRTLLTNIDFFDFSSGSSNSPMIQLKNSISGAFVILNAVSLLILLGILVYLAIRILMSVSGEEKSIHKTALTNWGISVALLFGIQVYIVGVIKFNSLAISIIEKSMSKDLFSDLFNPIKIFELAIFKAIPALIMYGIFVRYTVGFFFQYIKRMFRIAFLIIIAPLITITYSIDKIADSKAQAYEKWMKEFTIEVLIQPFHAIIFVILAKIAFAFLLSNQPIAGGILALVALRFMNEAEGLVKSIFQVNAQASTKGANSAVNAIVYSKLIQGLKKGGKEYVNEKYNSKFDKFRGETRIPSQEANIPVPDNSDSSQQAQQNLPIDSEVVESEAEGLNNEAIEGNVDNTLNTSEGEERLPQEEQSNVQGQDQTSRNLPNTNEENRNVYQKYTDLMKKLNSKRNVAAFGFGAAFAALEVGDDGNALFTNLAQGGLLGYSVGENIYKRYNSYSNKKEDKNLQKDNYKTNVKVTADELKINAEMYGALNNMPDFAQDTEKGKQLLLSWIEGLENKKPGDLLTEFNKNKNRLRNIYEKRDGNNKFEAENRIDELQAKFLAEGTIGNMNEYSSDEREFLSSMIEYKTIEEKNEIISSANLINENVYDEVKARVLESLPDNTRGNISQTSNGAYIRPSQDIIMDSNVMTADEDKEFRREYINELSSRDRKIETLVNEITTLTNDYERKYKMSVNEYEQKLLDDDIEFNELVKKHNSEVKKIMKKQKEVEEYINNEYIPNEKFKLPEELRKINTTEFNKFEAVTRRKLSNNNSNQPETSDSE